MIGNSGRKDNVRLDCGVVERSPDCRACAIGGRNPLMVGLRWRMNGQIITLQLERLAVIDRWVWHRREIYYQIPLKAGEPFLEMEEMHLRTDDGGKMFRDKPSTT